MGEIAEMMLTGVLCAMCGTALDCQECIDLGLPVYCSEYCAEGIADALICNHPMILSGHDTLPSWCEACDRTNTPQRQGDKVICTHCKKVIAIIKN